MSAMKRFRLTIGGIAGATILFWSLTFNARAAGDPKAEITEIEHKALDASTADELTAFYDQRHHLRLHPGLYVGAKVRTTSPFQQHHIRRFRRLSRTGSFIASPMALTLLDWIIPGSRRDAASPIVTKTPKDNAKSSTYTLRFRSIP
jgi:hypothetical protein